MRSILFAFLALCATLAQAQSYPSRPVRIVIGVPPGGLSDTLARATAQELSKRWSQSVVVENRAGGAGVIAADAVVKSAADGHQIFMTDSIQWVTNLLLRRNLPYDPVKDFAPAVGLVKISSLLVASNKSGLKSVDDLVARARAKPGELNYGSFGVGSAAHLHAEAFAVAYGIRLNHIPYKGGADIMKALLTGEVDLGFTGVTPAIPFVKQGQIRGIAYGSTPRSRSLPEVPTYSELGLRPFASGSWFGWLVPAGSPAPAVERVAADVGQVLAVPEFTQKFVLGAGMEPMHLMPAAFGELLRSDREKYGELVKSIKLTLD